MNKDIEQVISILEAENPIYRNIVEDAIAHMKMLDIEVTKKSLQRVLVNIRSEVEEMYKLGNRDGYYELYKIVENNFYISSDKFSKLKEIL